MQQAKETATGGVGADVLAAIPHRPPFLFIDAVRERGEGWIACERTFRAEEPFYAGHFPGNPVTPGVILCEAVFQAAAILFAESGGGGGLTGGGENGGAAPAAPAATPLLCRVETARFRQVVRPGDTVRIEARAKEKMQGFHFFDGKITLGGKTVLTLAFALTHAAPAR
ncbi:MAG: beta-hydroxyacyl-ACP dehydratase [Puniceicoccales bacterium]|jgi:3-hydroxyacyl-[acyl-carrier-protein] dehydratase|nr:beta-hydroxyacyl-ACP dehydratase [Puniceicoccales bacterium]